MDKKITMTKQEKQKNCFCRRDLTIKKYETKSSIVMDYMCYGKKLRVFCEHCRFNIISLAKSLNSPIFFIKNQYITKVISIDKISKHQEKVHFHDYCESFSRKK